MSAIPALVERGFEQIGRCITATQRANLAVLVAIETGRGGSTKNWNLGNITASSSWTGPAWRPPWYTVTASSSPRMRRLHDEMMAGRAPSAFRAYSSAEAGAKNFAEVLVARFPEVLSAAANADADAFRAALGQHYSPDYRRDAVTATIASLQRAFGLVVGGGAATLVLLAFGLLALRYLA